MATEEETAQWRKNWDRLFYPGTTTLVNYLNLRDAAELKEVEGRISSAVGKEISRNAVNGEFGLEHMRDIHRALFKRLYPWAGEVRDFGMTRPRPDDPHTTRFTPPDAIAATDQLLKQRSGAVLALKNEDFARHPQRWQQEFVNNIALAYQTANQMHPFREGNGRTQRIWLDQLAHASGWSLDYSKVEPRAWNYAAGMSANGELNGVLQVGKPNKLKQVFAHIATHQKALYNPYIQGKLGDYGSKARMLEIGELSPLLAQTRYKI